MAIDLGAAWAPRGFSAAGGDGAEAGGQGDAVPLDLDVEAQLTDGGAVVTLSIRGRAGALSKSSARGPTPMAAMVDAAAALAKQLAPAPMTADQIAAWGARDAASARRIRRVLYRMQLDLAPDDQAAARELLATDGDSPWTHLIAIQADVGGAQGQEESAKRVLERLDKLPRGRALLLRGILLSRDAIGRPLPAEEQLAWMEQAATKAKKAPDRVALRTLVALARLSTDPKHRRAAEKALKDAEALAGTESIGGRIERDGILVRTVPAVRKLRGDAEAAKRWRETERAPFHHRCASAFDAALALEATGDAAGAEQAYRLAMDPEGVDVDALATIAARVKLAALYRAQKRDADADALDGEVARVWASADAGLREVVLRLR